MSTSYTVQQLAALKAAYARGVTEVMQDGARIRYASMTEMAQAIAQMESELASAGLIAPPGSPTVRYATWDRG